MTAKPTLAALLADGQWHRGPTLAAALGISRAAVSTRIAELCERGLDVYAVAGRGYRLSAPLELLDADRIREAVTPRIAVRLDDLEVLERVDSTNAELGRRAARGTRALLAEYQSAGRGRAQRAWVSPYGANLYLSLACDMAAPRAPLGALSLAVGVNVAATLTDLGAVSIGLKWPNDLWAGGRKLGGLLIEHRGEVGGSARMVVGIGLNVTMQPEQAAAVDQSWTRLADHVAQLPARNRLAARVLEALIEAVTRFEADGFAGFRDRWMVFDVVAGHPVRVFETAGERAGIARGIAADGALVVEFDGVPQPVYSGDVSLRLGS